MSASITSSYFTSLSAREPSAAVAARDRPRLAQVDVLRGLLILLMCSTHALTLAGVSSDSWLFHWWLPRGWGTHGFIIVSGFTLSFVLGIVGRSERLEWANRRGLQLLAIAMGSNVFFGLGKAVIETGTASPVAGGQSISAILYPTAVLLLILPTVSTAAAGLGAGRFLGLAVSLMVAMTGAGGLPHAWWALMLPGGAAMVSTLLMLSEGLVGYAVGLRLRSAPVPSAVLWTLVVLSAPVATLLGDDLYAIRAVARLALLAGLVTAVVEAGMPGAVTNGFAVVGRYPLMAFLLHRVMMQGLRVSLPRTAVGAGLDAEVCYWVYFLVTGAIVWGLARLRATQPALDQRLKAVWL